MRNIADKVCSENQNTHFMFNSFSSKTVSFKRKCGKVCSAGKDTDKNIIRRMRFAYGITKATNTGINGSRTRLDDSLQVKCLSCICDNFDHI
jgi:hypothetical protein